MMAWLPAIPEGTPLWLYAACMAGAVMIIGIAKSGFGGGVGILAVPLMAIALPIDATVGVMLPVLIAADVFAVAQHRKHFSKPHLGWLLSGAAVGVGVGTLLLIWLRESQHLHTGLNLIVGVLCLALVGLQALRMIGAKLPRVPATAWPGCITGVGAGIASTFAHAAGPIASLYMLEVKLDKRTLVATSAVFFFVLNLMKLPTYFGLGLIDPSTLTQSLWCLPLIPLGAWLGLWMHHRIAERPFTAVMYASAALAASRMIWKAVS